LICNKLKIEPRLFYLPLKNHYVEIGKSILKSPHVLFNSISNFHVLHIGKLIGTMLQNDEDGRPNQANSNGFF
jgi:hypothetical protein